MKKSLLITFVALLLALPMARANDIFVNITQTQSVTEIQSEIQSAIDNATSSDMVMVTGSKTDANLTLTLNIPEGKTVVWQATYQSSAALGSNTLISFTGDGILNVANGALITANATALTATGNNSTTVVSGTGKVQTEGNGVHAITTSGNVEVKDNAQVSGTTGEVIDTYGDNSIVTVSGGTVTATSENAIIARGINAQVLVSGGYVSNEAVGNYPVIFMYDNRFQQFIHVSGTAKVEAKGDGFAIMSYSDVKVNGNAQINNTGRGEASGAIRGISKIEVSGNAIISASSFYSILSNSDVTISGNSKIVAKENAVAVGGSFIEVKDQSQVIAAQNYAIALNENSNPTLSIIGGLVFSYGNKMADVIDWAGFTGPTEFGTIVAWNKEAGNTEYELLSTDDIFKLPASAAAYWDNDETQFGITYANGANTGFIPLDVSVFEEGKYFVNVSVNNDEYGSATGGGFYEENTTATVTATANTGYKFINWTQNGEIIATDNPYSFTVTKDTELVANFEDEVGVSNFELSTIQIYPNPTSGELRVTSYRC